MSKKTLSAIIITGLLGIAIIPAYDFFKKEDLSNQNVVFEYNGKKVYETEMLPYINYYLKMNNIIDDVEAKNRAVDNYIRSVLLSKFAEDSGYSVDKSEVEEFIKKSTPFIDNEKFSVEKYHKFLKDFNIKVDVFEEEIKKDLLIMKMMNKVDDISNIENYYFDIINEVLAQKRTIKKVKLKLDSFPVVYDKNLLEEKYKANKEKYKKPDFIIFSKNTFIHPLNQSDKDKDIDSVIVDTNSLYNDIKNTNANNLSSKLIEGFKTSTMMLEKENFYNLIGTKNINSELKKGTFFIDNSDIDNGVLIVYEVTNISQGEIKNFSEAYYDLTKDYELEVKIEKAYETISDYGNIKNAVGNYFEDYQEEIIDPLKNDKSELLYKLVYSLPLNGLKLYYNEDNDSYYFVQLSKIEKIDLTKEQLDYFRKSQNNMYKQFVLISLYDSVKKNYNLIKYKKES